jgi:16S rRNA (cytosine1402-N4)-methyltransferase
MNNAHVPVMLSEATEALQIHPNEWYIDATFGGGGHTGEILRQGGNVLAFDWDRPAIEAGNKKFADHINQGKLVLIRESFAKLHDETTKMQTEQKVGRIQGILFDFGTSTDQLLSSERGFSFTGDGELDMRMDDRLGVQAKDILAVVPEKQLSELFLETGGEPQARKIAKAIKSSPVPITTTGQLAELVKKVKKGRTGKLHPATKVFQALRIAVNSELEQISLALPQALDLLQPGGSIVTIAFHEGEDRIAKRYFREWAKTGLGEESGPFTPADGEVQKNPRARSAKLRVFRKTNE